MFSFKFVAYQPLIKRCQVSCVNKQQVETDKNIRTMFIAWEVNLEF